MFSRELQSRRTAGPRVKLFSSSCPGPPSLTLLLSRCRCCWSFDFWVGVWGRVPVLRSGSFFGCSVLLGNRRLYQSRFNSGAKCSGAKEKCNTRSPALPAVLRSRKNTSQGGLAYGWRNRGTCREYSLAANQCRSTHEKVSPGCPHQAGHPRSGDSFYVHGQREA